MSRYHIGKQAEREIAKRFNAKRNYLAQAEGGADIHTDWLCIEVFTHEHPDYLLEELWQAMRDANSKQLPIAIWHEKGKNYDDALVIIRLKDFQEQFES